MSQIFKKLFEATCDSILMIRNCICNTNCCFALICFSHSSAVGVGFYGNSETNDGVYQLTYSIYNANHTLGGIGSLVRVSLPSPVTHVVSFHWNSLRNIVIKMKSEFFLLHAACWKTKSRSLRGFLLLLELEYDCNMSGARTHAHTHIHATVGFTSATEL